MASGYRAPRKLQTPGGDIASNLKSFRNLHVLDGDGTDPGHAARLTQEAVDFVRLHRGPALLRLTVRAWRGIPFRIRRPTNRQRRSPPNARAIRCRSCTTMWCPANSVKRNGAASLRTHRMPSSRRIAKPKRGRLPTLRARRNTCSSKANCRRKAAVARGYVAPPASEAPQPEGQRINMVTAIRRTPSASLRSIRAW